LVAKSDTDAAAVRIVVECWKDAFGLDPLTAADMARALTPDSHSGLPPERQRVADALGELCRVRAGNTLDARGIGNKLRKLRGKVVGSVAIEKASGELNEWFLRSPK